MNKVQAKSFVVVATTGSSTLTNIALNGQNARILGIVCNDSLSTTVLDFSVDNTVYIDGVPGVLFNKSAENPSPYTQLPIEVTGSSSIKLVCRATVLDTFAFTVWYLSN